MMTDKTKTPQKIFLQENYGKQEYGIGQDGNVCGMVRYFRCDDDYRKICKILAIALIQYFDGPDNKVRLTGGERINIEKSFELGDWNMIYSIYRRVFHSKGN